MWLKNSKVGQNIGGIDILGIDDWNWGKNHAWIKAAIFNTKEGKGIVRFITLFDKANIFVNPKIPSKGLTITGNEFAVMLNHDFGVDIDGIMKPLSELNWQEWWGFVLNYAKNNPQYIKDPSPKGNALDVINEDLYNTLKNGNLNIFENKEAGQTKFFGYFKNE